ncbi:ATP-dependent DNA helicase RecQ [bacterium CPR1]|nr:ATP-dependent DNA helicase RecQ [bacterium CPR1]
MHSLEHELRSTFAHGSFRPHQKEVVEAVLAGRSVLAVLPTGSGKSLCYQLPGLLSEGPTVVVSPLLALIQDQVGALRRLGVSDVYSLTNLQSPEENQAALGAIAAGRARFVFAAPERFTVPGLMQALGTGQVPLLAIDEAHLICEWGHDFRPDYLRLKSVLSELKPRSVLALTATATPRVQRGIVYALGLSSVELVVGAVDRPNLSMIVQSCPAIRRTQEMGRLLSAPEALPALVYVARKRDAQKLAEWLSERGVPALPYHAGLHSEVRRSAQQAFLSGRIPVLVATMAFGMGVDKPDIRTVVHFQAPASLEAYFQEAGRAGRDGRPARSVVLHDPLDRDILSFYHERRFPTLEDLEQVRAALDRRVPFAARNEFPTWTDGRWNLALGALIGYDGPRNVRYQPATTVAGWMKVLALKKADRERLDAMLAFLEVPACRRQRLLEYFGQPPASFCENCDHCLRARPVAPGVRLRRKPGSGLESREELSSPA